MFLNLNQAAVQHHRILYDYLIIYHLQHVRQQMLVHEYQSGQMEVREYQVVNQVQDEHVCRSFTFIFRLISKVLNKKKTIETFFQLYLLMPVGIDADMDVSL